MDLTMADPKGLVRESYAIEGITAPECRSIFLDWALSLAAGVASDEAARALVAHYALSRPDHPMSEVLRAGLEKPPAGGTRRGGRKARVSGGDGAPGPAP